MKKNIGKIIVIILCILFLTTAGFCARQLNAKESTGGYTGFISAYNGGEFTKAIGQLRRFALLRDINAYLTLAVIFKDLGHYQRALYTLRNAGVACGADSRIDALQAEVYYLSGQPLKALKGFLKVLAAKPTDPAVKVSLGLCYEDMGEISKAIVYFTKALAIDKFEVTALIHSADLYSRKGNLALAAKLYKKVLAVDPTLTGIQKSLAGILFKMEDLPGALKLYRKLNIIEPQNPLVSAKIREISQALGQEYFEKEKAAARLSGKRKLISVKPFPETGKIPSVKIGLATNLSEITFTCSAKFDILTVSDGITVVTVKEGQRATISWQSGRRLIITDAQKERIIVDESVVILPSRPQATTTLFNLKFGGRDYWAGFEDRAYRGRVQINSLDKGLTVVNIVNMEECLYGVLPSEMPVSWPREALKAQCVAARSEAFYKIGRHRAEGFDFCAEVHCQVYRGVGQETDAGNKIVDETRGIVMTFGRRPIDAVYSNNCGGHTQNNIFGKGNTVPYLQSTLDVPWNSNSKGSNFPLSALAFEYWLKEPPKGILCNVPQSEGASNFRWKRVYSAFEMDEMANKISNVGKVRKIQVTSRLESGHIAAIKIFGSKASCVVEKELVIRRALGNLRSSMFNIEIKYGRGQQPESFIFYGGGWGHGVGMCQHGALGMANLGMGYKDILKHYYQGVEFEDIYAGDNKRK